VISAGENSRIQALDRTQKLLPVQAGQTEQRTHDCFRHGTATLFAALEITTGTVTGICNRRRRHQEFLVFLKLWPAPTRCRVGPHEGQLRHPQRPRS
jgi:hypothetical protein